MNRRTLIANSLFLFLLLTPLSRGGEKTAKAAKPVEVTWHGQSFFTVTSSQGTRVVFDPHFIPEYGRVLGLKADIILISHEHYDHNRPDVVENEKQAKTILGWTGTGSNKTWNIVDEQVKDVHIRSVASYHDDVQGMKYGKNTIFIVDVDGWHIVHLGDLGHMLSEETLKKIGPVDVLMVPVGGIYTLNGGEARTLIEKMKPKEYIFPMHRGTKVYDAVLPADEFLEGQSKDRIAVSDDNRVSLNKDAVRPRPLIVMLNYWPKATK